MLTSRKHTTRLLASIAALLLLAATAGCTGGGEPEATATASGDGRRDGCA